jgi:hypothetical protein
MWIRCEGGICNLRLAGAVIIRQNADTSSPHQGKWEVIVATADSRLHYLHDRFKTEGEAVARLKTIEGEINARGGFVITNL